MYVTGIQPVGGHGVGGVQPLVAVSRTSTSTDEATSALGARVATGQGTRNLTVEGQTVVFHRGGPDIDWRPVDVRRREAEHRYREANGLLDDDDDAEEQDDVDRFTS